MEEDRQEPIIVRRSAGRQKDQLKGGVWKIAHADFMTAMMALFLVLWLVNSANRETRTSVAQYFNPIRLSDATTDRKGIRNPQDVKTGDRDSIYLHDGEGEAEANPAAEAAGAISQAARLKRAETGKGALDDPYRLLAEATPASADPAAEPARPALAAGGPGKPGLTGSEVLRDPFDPEFWRQAALAGATAKPSDQPDETAPVAPKSAGAPDETAQGETTALARTTLGKMAPAPGQPEPAAGAAATQTPPAPAGEPVLASAALPMSPRPGLTASQPPGAAPLQASLRPTDKVAAAIVTALGGAGQRSDTPQVEVRQTDDSVLISLTDKVNFGMFAIGSAEPHPQTVAVMQQIAGVLKQREGQIIIRGHTDARRFRDPTRDNWQLSTERARTARDLLVRGGVDEARIDHIEGYASRRPRADDPNAAENRRIEILLREKRA